MAKVKANAAEIVITIVAIIILLSSCGSTSDSVMKYGVSPKYMQFDECMYADQEWEDIN